MLKYLSIPSTAVYEWQYVDRLDGTKWAQKVSNYTWKC